MKSTCTAHSFCFLRTARIARALRCDHSFARSLTRTRAHGKEVFVHEFNASISCNFNPLWAARLCAFSLSVVIAAPLTRFSRTMGKMTIKSTHRVLGHSLVRSHIRFLCTARFARALSCAHLFARSPTHSLAPELMGKRFLFKNLMRLFQAVSIHCGPRVFVRVCAPIPPN